MAREDPGRCRMLRLGEHAHSLRQGLGGKGEAGALAYRRSIDGALRGRLRGRQSWRHCMDARPVLQFELVQLAAIHPPGSFLFPKQL